ncbi:MAG: hypothetical protein RBS17_06525 [Coriobacteriia bacterium]|nr:hypothetical protein [Coriobacteriia bacterium]
MQNRAETRILRTGMRVAACVMLLCLAGLLASCISTSPSGTDTAFNVLLDDASLGASTVLGVSGTEYPVLIAGRHVLAVDEECDISQAVLLSDQYSPMSQSAEFGQPYVNGARSGGDGLVYFARHGISRTTDGLENESFISEDELVLIDPIDPLSTTSVVLVPGLITRFAGSMPTDDGVRLAAVVWEPPNVGSSAVGVYVGDRSEWNELWSSASSDLGMVSVLCLETMMTQDDGPLIVVVGKQTAEPTSSLAIASISARGDYARIDLSDTGAIWAEAIGVVTTPTGVSMAIAVEYDSGDEGLLLLNAEGHLREFSLSGRAIGVCSNVVGQGELIVVRGANARLSFWGVDGESEIPVDTGVVADLVLPGDLNGDGVEDLLLLASSREMTPSGQSRWRVGWMPGDKDGAREPIWGAYLDEDLISVDLLDVDADSGLEIVLGLGLDSEGRVSLLSVR